MIVNIELPFFPGFYDSALEDSDTAYWAIKEELQYYQEECDTPCPELTEDDLDFDYEQYREDVRNAWVDAWKDHAPEIVLSVEDVVMTSPRYYNFDTDRVYADVELREDWMDEMRHFIALNYDWLKERIHEDWTSYDGFCSFMSNDVDEWPSYLFEEQDSRYISTMIGYMMYRANKEIRNDLVMFALDDIYAGSYVSLTEEGQAKVDEGIENGTIQVYDPDQLKITFPED
jgi:hypothetical protein